MLNAVGQCKLFYPRILSAETVEVFAKDFRNDNIKDIEKAANTDTFLANRYSKKISSSGFYLLTFIHNRFGNKNAYMFFSLRIFYESLALNSLISTDSTPNTPIISKKSNLQCS